MGNKRLEFEKQNREDIAKELEKSPDSSLQQEAQRQWQEAENIQHEIDSEKEK